MSLALKVSPLPRLAATWMVHVMRWTRFGAYVCTARGCQFITDNTAEMMAHVSQNQFRVDG